MMGKQGPSGAKFKEALALTVAQVQDWHREQALP